MENVSSVKTRDRVLHSASCRCGYGERESCVVEVNLVSGGIVEKSILARREGTSSNHGKNYAGKKDGSNSFVLFCAFLWLNPGIEAITDPGFGEDVAWCGDLRFELLAQVADEHAQVFVLLDVVTAPESGK